MKRYEISFPEDGGVKFEMFRYPAGESQVRLTPGQFEAVAEAEEIWVTARIYDGDIMPLALLTDALRYANNGNARNWVLILPYLPYSRADRRFTSGDCHALRVFGRHLDDLAYDLVATVDVHSAIAKRYVSNLLNVGPEPIIAAAMKRIAPCPVILLPDEGALRYKMSPVLRCSKRRDPASGQLSGFAVPCREEFGDAKSVLIVDDICDGGGTFVGIAKELAGYGLDLYLYVTHGIFSKGMRELEKHFKRVVTTDSMTALSLDYVRMPTAGLIWGDVTSVLKKKNPPAEAEG